MIGRYLHLVMRTNMKTEHEFNKFLTRQFKILGTEYKAIKTSDRFKIGLPDWIVIHKGRTVAIEVKFVRSIPKKGKLLKHEVSGAQRSNLTSFKLAGAPSFVLIGVGDQKTMYVFRSLDSGNITVEELNELIGVYNTWRHDFSDVKDMIKRMIQECES